MIQQYTDEHPRLLIGPGIGADAAAIEVNSPVIVAKSDPITFPTPDSGRYLVHINANDIACMGAVPKWLLVTALLPEHRTDETLVESIFSGLADAANELGVTLIGGHAEITIGLDRPILVGQMLGETTAERLYDLRTAVAGDKALLVNGIAIEGTAILANDGKPEDLAGISSQTLERARSFAEDPGISVVKSVLALQAAGAKVRGCHDPTEGGLATALRELAAVTSLGLELNTDDVFVYPETFELCARTGLDPLGLIASGALLAVIDPDGADEVVDSLNQHDLQAAIIGTMLEDASDLHMLAGSSHQPMPLPTFVVDEIARYFNSDK